MLAVMAFVATSVAAPHATSVDGCKAEAVAGSSLSAAAPGDASAGTGAGADNRLTTDASTGPAGSSGAGAGDGPGAVPVAAATDADAGGASGVGAAPHECFMMVSNVGKRHNVGSLMRSCVAFGVKKLIVCGTGRAWMHGARGTDRYMEVESYPRIRDAVASLKARGVAICGIEITPDAAPVETHPFRGPTAFLAGAEGAGLHEAHKALCDHFVYIKQCGVGGTASLNVAIASSIVLHHFSVWAGYPELPRDSGGLDKFAMTAPPREKGRHTATATALRAAREATRAAACEVSLGSAFGEDEFEDDEHGDGEGDDDDDGADAAQAEAETAGPAAAGGAGAAMASAGAHSK